MAIVAGIDFGTLSVRVSLVDHRQGRLGSATAAYPLLRQKEDPACASQRYEDHMAALVTATNEALVAAGIKGEDVQAVAVATTGSTVVPVDEQLRPLDNYYLWCDHRAEKEAAEITAAAHREGLEAIRWCGGVYSSEMGFSKLLHWLRHNPGKRDRLATMVEHCDLTVAVITGRASVAELRRSRCALGHKWLWHESAGGLPPEDFLRRVDARLTGVRAGFAGPSATSDRLAGHLSPDWARKLGLRAGIPVPVGALDAHWDAIGAGIREGDVVNVVGTSTCVMAIVKEASPIPGVCGVVKGSIHPNYYGIEAGLSATGEIFDAIARRAGGNVDELSRGLDRFGAGQTGLLRIVWDNGDRTVLANPGLGGVTLGWNLLHTAQDELFSAIEGTAFHTRIVLERMAEYGVPIRRVINGGGIPQKSAVLNQVYANVFNKLVLVAQREVTSLGSAIFAFLAAGVFKTLEEAQEALCPSYRVFEPEPRAVAIYEGLFAHYRRLYFALGRRDSAAEAMGDVLPALRQIAARTRLDAAVTTPLA
jgi:L-ribulokinase